MKKQKKQVYSSVTILISTVYYTVLSYNPACLLFMLVMHSQISLAWKHDLWEFLVINQLSEIFYLLAIMANDLMEKHLLKTE